MRPVDLVNGRISVGLRLADIAAARGDAEHAAAIGKDSRAVALGAGMEDLHVGIGDRVSLARSVLSFILPFRPLNGV